MLMPSLLIYLLWDSIEQNMLIDYWSAGQFAIEYVLVRWVCHWVHYLSWACHANNHFLFTLSVNFFTHWSFSLATFYGFSLCSASDCQRQWKTWNVASVKGVSAGSMQVCSLSAVLWGQEQHISPADCVETCIGMQKNEQILRETHQNVICLLHN